MLSLFVNGDQLVHEMHSVLLQLIGLDLVVSVLVDLSEYGVNVLISDWKMDFVGLEECIQELSQLLPVQEPVCVLVELCKVFLNLF